MLYLTVWYANIKGWYCLGAGMFGRECKNIQKDGTWGNKILLRFFWIKLSNSSENFRIFGLLGTNLQKKQGKIRCVKTVFIWIFKQILSKTSFNMKRKIMKFLVLILKKKFWERNAENNYEILKEYKFPSL